LVHATPGLDRDTVTPASGRPHTLLSAAHTAVCLGAFAAPRSHSLLLMSCPQLLSGDRLPTVPSRQQATDCRMKCLSLPAPHQCQRMMSVVVVAYPPPKPCLSVVYQEEGKGPPPLRSQGSPLRSDPFLRYRCGVDKPLTSFTPLVRSNYRAFSESPASHFSFPDYLATRGIAVPGLLPLLFCFAGARSPQAGGADSVKP
jgi:hypothetical protein